jgi:hypothetical protein
VVKRPAVQAELRAVSDAAQRRLGEDVLRDLLWGREESGGGVEPCEELAGIRRALASINRGETAQVVQQ